MNTIVYPVLKFMENDRYMATIVAHFISDKAFLNKSSVYNTDFEIIDSAGQCFSVKELINPKFSLWLSIKYIGCIYQVEPVYDYLNAVTLIELKERVLKHVNKNKKFWNAIDDGRGLERMINEASSFKELIMMFK